MALKDWKKEKRNDKEYYWSVFKNEKTHQSIYCSQEYSYNGTKYLVDIQDWTNWGGKQIEYKKFRLKSQALTFARAYMRKH